MSHAAWPSRHPGKGPDRCAGEDEEPSASARSTLASRRFVPGLPVVDELDWWDEGATSGDETVEGQRQPWRTSAALPSKKRKKQGHEGAPAEVNPLSPLAATRTASAVRSEELTHTADALAHGRPTVCDDEDCLTDGDEECQSQWVEKPQEPLADQTVQARSSTDRMQSLSEQVVTNVWPAASDRRLLMHLSTQQVDDAFPGQWAAQFVEHFLPHDLDVEE